MCYAEIGAQANQFKIDNILDYLMNAHELKDSMKIVHEFFLGFLDEYNKLSSFIHGGPYAEKYSFDDKDHFQKFNISTTKEWAESIYNNLLVFFFLFLGKEESQYLFLMRPYMESLSKS
jgi:hypothetical protein